MGIIKHLSAHEILDSRGNPTVEVTLTTNKVTVNAQVPSGASTGVHEALELRDKEKRYQGLGVQKAIRNVNQIIAPKLIGKNCTYQQKIDKLLCSLDGTANKSKLGANALLGVSLACAKAAAASQNQPLYQYLNTLLKTKRKMIIPTPYLNSINGGKHADNDLAFQEFMLVPQCKTANENIRAASEIYHVLKKDIHKKYGKATTNVGDEGGFAPPLKTVKAALQILNQAISDAGYKGKVTIAIDCAASEFYSKGKYRVDNKALTKDQLLHLYLQLIREFPISSIEDPFEQEDFAFFAQLRAKTNIQIVGDDLTVTNVQRLKTAIEHKSINCLLLKVNQIGTLSEALAAAELAFRSDLKVMVSHRSAETVDTFIADLAVALGCGQIKAGAPCRGERVAKYNSLLEIEREI